jgi:hypothetical protein
MYIKLIHKLSKDSVVLYALSRKDEYQGEMSWESTQIFQALFVRENDLKRNIWKMYLEDCLT